MSHRARPAALDPGLPARGFCQQRDNYLPGALSKETTICLVPYLGEEVGELCLADEFGAVEGVEEAGAEEVGEGCEVLGWHAVEVAFFVEEPVGGEDQTSLPAFEINDLLWNHNEP